MKRDNWRSKFWNDEHIIKTVVLKSLPKGQRGITKVYFVKSLGGTPARCLRSTGECWISLDDWKKLSYEQKVFILLHENEHIVQNTSDEIAVDREAHKKYIRMGLSLKKSVRCLTDVLSYEMPEHFTRTRNQMIRAIIHDVTINGNKDLEKRLKEIVKQKRKTNI